MLTRRQRTLMIRRTFGSLRRYKNLMLLDHLLQFTKASERASTAMRRMAGAVSLMSPWSMVPPGDFWKDIAEAHRVLRRSPEEARDGH